MNAGKPTPVAQAWQLPSPASLFALIGSLLLSCVILLVVPEAQFPVFTPGYAALYVFVAFGWLLYRRVGNDVFGEIGFLFLGLALAYTILPAFTFLALDLDFATGPWESLAQLLPESSELARHLWRHVLFMVAVALGYLCLPKGAGSPGRERPNTQRQDRQISFALLIVICIAIASIFALSAPVESYIDHYTRFDHLSSGLRALVYVLLMLKTSAYYILLTLLFGDFRRNRLLIVGAIVAIAGYETAYSLGSRIETLSILLATACLYHHRVRPISLKAGTLALVAIATLFSVIEVIRSLEFDVADARNLVAAEGATPAAEFGAVFFTGFHLYGERAAGSLPPIEWPMFINDVLALIPFVDHVEWNPMYWYARHYYPDATVPPQTMGPIADSAIWGGEVDLFFRGALVGLWYAMLMRWYLRRRDLWWATVIYVYLFATCVLTLKYSVFYQLGPLTRILLPGIVLVAGLRWVVRRASAVSRLRATGRWEPVSGARR